MLLVLMGVLLLLGVATVGAGIVTAAVLLAKPPLSLANLCAALVLIFSSSAVVVYCYGWWSVTLGGPFPELCEDRNASGAELISLQQEYWPLRSACGYTDGSTVEHVDMSINVLVWLLAGLAVVLTGAAAFLHRRAAQTPERNTVHLA